MSETKKEVRKEVKLDYFRKAGHAHNGYGAYERPHPEVVTIADELEGILGMLLSRIEALEAKKK